MSTYFINLQETGRIHLSDKLDSIYWCLGPYNLIIDESTVEKRLNWAIRPFYDILFIQPLASIVQIEIKHAQNIVNWAAD